MKNRKFVLSLFIACLFLDLTKALKKVPHKNKSLSFKKNKKKTEEEVVVEKEDEVEILDIVIDFDNPRANVEAVHITLGDYFNDRTSENIYRVGFLLKNPELRTNLSLKIKIPRKNHEKKELKGKIKICLIQR